MSLFGKQRTRGIGMEKNVNPVLQFVMQEIYKKRKPLPEIPRTVVRYEKVQDKIFSEIWFMTPGCTHDRNGGCTMCNYGKGNHVSPKEIACELAIRIRQLPKNLQELIITPTGSMLDEQEVPLELFTEILGLLKHTTINDFLIETRIDTVSAEKLELMKQTVHADRIFIETGIEAWDDWILRNCVNKNMKLKDLGPALNTIHHAGMYACANIGIGIPFLNERMSIKVAVTSVETALKMGFDSVVLFPYHVKPGTLSAWLWEQNLYQCCSLWALIEVLGTFPAEMLDKIHISWYRNYYDDPQKILLSPDTCDTCREDVLKLLDDYKNHPCQEVRGKLLSLSCSCRDIWKQKLLLQPDYVEMDQIAAIYRKMGHAFGISPNMVEQEIICMIKE